MTYEESVLVPIHIGTRTRLAAAGERGEVRSREYHHAVRTARAAATRVPIGAHRRYDGKGSTAAMLDSILRAAGLRAGLYTSPHLERINERIRLDGWEISDVDFAGTFTRLRKVIEELLAVGKLAAHPTFLNASRLWRLNFSRVRARSSLFARWGMGGRLDRHKHSGCPKSP